ncbi:MAG: zf-TFIIB domain-containing protein [Thermoleophilia bacterium]|nr:zf-TFIIB domain-containing protein [Thermoleophilia bacterium]
MQCPKCSVEMDEVRKLDVVVDSCSKCGGVWLDRGELDKIRKIEADYDRDDANPGSHHHSPGEDHDRHDKHSKDGKKKKKRGGFMDILEGFGGD